MKKLDLNNLDRPDAYLGRQVFHEGQQGTLRGLGPSEGLWWATVDLDEGTEIEVLLSELAVPDDGRW